MRERDAALEARIDDLSEQIASLRRQLGPWRRSPEALQVIGRLERRLAMLMEHQLHGDGHA